MQATDEEFCVTKLTFNQHIFMMFNPHCRNFFSKFLHLEFGLVDIDNNLLMSTVNTRSQKCTCTCLVRQMPFGVKRSMTHVFPAVPWMLMASRFSLGDLTIGNSFKTFAQLEHCLQELQDATNIQLISACTPAKY